MVKILKRGQKPSEYCTGMRHFGEILDWSTGTVVFVTYGSPDERAADVDDR